MSLKQKSLVVFFGGAMDSFHESMRKVYLKYKPMYENSGHKVDYHYWTCGGAFDIGLASLAINHKKVVDNLDNSSYDNICIIGHSYGGDTAMKVASSCKRDIRLLVTLDPVSQRGFIELISISKPDNVFKWINVYVPLSTISFLGGQWGKQTKANINIPCHKKEKNGAVVDVEHGDADIMYNKVVKDVEKVLNSTKPTIPALSKININKELFQKDMKLPVDALLVKPSFSNKEYHINSQEPTGLISVKGAFSKSLRRIKSIKPLKKK